MSATDQEEKSEHLSESDTRNKRGSAGGSATERHRSGVPPTTNLEEMKIEQLYLLEILVNSIEVLKESSQLNLQNNQDLPPLNVRIKFIDFPCIEISQDDFLDSKKDEPKDEEAANQSGPAESDQLQTKSSLSNADSPSKGSGKLESGKGKRAGETPNVSLSTGKSCLFPMIPMEFLRQVQRHPIMLHVFRKNSENETFMIGHCKVRLGPEFEDAIIKAVFDNLPLPISTTIESDCKLTNSLGDETGILSVFIRLSCFGATIITEFQLVGEDSDGYIFKTSKKDNTLEAQKKKSCVLFNKAPFKKETPVKSLNPYDISPLQPILATEENINPISGENNNPYLATPFKVVPWKKYISTCGCEDPNDDYDDPQAYLPTPFGICGCGQNANIPPYIDQTRMCNVPPCPLPDCDCYSSVPQSRNQDKSSLINQIGQTNNTGTGCCLGADGTTCTDGPASSSKLDQSSKNFNQRHNCPVEDCDCFPSPQNPPPMRAPSQQANKPMGTANPFNSCCPCTSAKRTQSKNCPVDYCECFNNKQRTDFIRKKSPPVSAPYVANNSPTGDCFSRSRQQQQQQGCCGSPIENGVYNIDQENFRKRNSQGGNQQYSSGPICPSSCGKKQNPAEEKCFFDGFPGNQTHNLNSPNGFNQPNSIKCKIGYNNRNECFCYGGGTNKPYSDTFENQYTQRLSSDLTQPIKGSINTPGPRASTQEKINPNQTEEPLQPVAEEERNSVPKTEEIGGGGDSNLPEMSVMKESSKEKSLDLSKKTSAEEDVKKTNDVPEFQKEQEPEDKKQNKDEKIPPDTPKSSNGRHKKKRRFSSVFHYSAGMYPGIVIGHRHCGKDFRFVPKTMGWLWNVGDLGDNLRPRRGWRPGAINKTIAKMIRHGKLAAGLLVEEEKEDKKGAKGGAKGGAKRPRRPFTPRSGGVSSNQNSGEYSAVPQPPTLHLHKKDGAYFISMNPLKAESDDEEEDRPPLMFKILPHEDEASTTSESSIEIEFTAPGAFRKKVLKPVMETIDTQYSDPESVLEILPPPAQKGKKGAPGSKKEAPKDAAPTSNPPSTMASVEKDNKWDADQPTQVAKTGKAGKTKK